MTLLFSVVVQNPMSTKKVVMNQISSRQRLVSDLVKELRLVLAMSAEIDENDVTELNDLDQRTLSILRMINEIADIEKRVFLYDREKMTDVEFARFVLNTLYSRFFNEFVASSKVKMVVYKGIRDSFRVYDVPTYRIRLFVLDRSTIKMATDWFANERGNALGDVGNDKGRGKDGIIEREKRYRTKLMLMSRANIINPIIMNAMVPVFHSPSTIEHMRFLVEHDEYKQIMDVRRKMSSKRGLVNEFDWDSVLDSTVDRTSSSFVSKLQSQDHLDGKDMRMGSLGRDIGIGFAFAMLIPKRSSMSMRSALLMNDNRIDNSLGPAIIDLFKRMVSADLVVHDFTIDDVCVEIKTEQGSFGIVKTCRLNFASMKNNASLKTNDDDESMNPENSEINDSMNLFSLTFYCSVLVQIFRLHTAIYIGRSVVGSKMGHMLNDPLVPYVQAQTHGNMQNAVKIVDKIMSRDRTHGKHLQKVLNSWRGIRESEKKHGNSLTRRLYPETEFRLGSLTDVLTCIHMQYEDVSMRR